MKSRAQSNNNEHQPPLHPSLPKRRQVAMFTISPEYNYLEVDWLQESGSRLHLKINNCLRAWNCPGRLGLGCLRLWTVRALVFKNVPNTLALCGAIATSWLRCKIRGPRCVCYGGKKKNIKYTLTCHERKAATRCTHTVQTVWRRKPLMENVPTTERREQ